MVEPRLASDAALEVFVARQESGAQGRNRTTDTAIFSRMLYQLSYLGNCRMPPSRILWQGHCV